MPPFSEIWYSKKIIASIVAILFFISCNNTENKLFKNLPSSQTGITFRNTITETDSLNILNFHYIYNGGGVGVGDFDKNGLPDLIFSGNQVPSKIYLNKGELKFEDISNAANFSAKGWATGVSIIDINADGWEDIYISVGGFNCDGNCNNQLFINQGLNKNGIPTFKEMANEYGLDDGLYTQQAAFFDYDLDGDLDVYLLHNVIDVRDKNAPSKKKFINKKSKDQLLENINGKYLDRSDSLGITHRGYGLGVTINDFNMDGWPDIYVANDFLSDDLLYLNNKKGFTEISHDVLKHTSYNSMGVDVADINNDALPDIYVVDMLPEYQERQKNMMGFMNYNKFLFSLRQGYAPQFVRNTLQLHNGHLNNEIISFSEAGYLTGLYKTDWSWTPLLADFDNDGDRDVFVTNGYGKDITDLDFINYSNKSFNFGTPEARQKQLFETVQQMESIKLPNYIFENNGDLNFTKRSDQWMDKINSISNGAVYTDLDNDGDLDIAVNNIDDEAFVLENTLLKNETNNYLKVKLKGTAQNPSAIGAKIFVWTNEEKQFHFQSPVRGYLSTVESIVHFGFGENKKIDSLKIIWPNQKTQLLKNIPTNQLLELNIADAGNTRTNSNTLGRSLFFKTASDFPIIKHTENLHSDYDAQHLLLHQHSQQGPCLAAANIDGQPGDEIFMGGAKGKPSRIFFENKIITLADSLSEDVDAAFFDFENDGDMDLYVVSGGSEFLEGAAEYNDRLYLNNGNGNFELKKELLPNIKSSGSCAQPFDFDKDGDLDLFVGGRVAPRKFPDSPKSFLLKNENGKFVDATPDGLKNIGMVTDAAWSDYDNDGWTDLIIVGEWMPITIFKNDNGLLSLSQPLNFSLSGLWNSIAAADIDNDGDADYIVGNLGINSHLIASTEKPLYLYKNDFDNNGSPDPFIGHYYLNKKGEEKLYPLHARDDVMKQLVKLKNRYVKYAEFGQATFDEIMQSDISENDFLIVNELSSMILKNNGNGNFEKINLPLEAQFAPVRDILINDFDGDGNVDALLSGNDYSAEKNGGWHDALNGLFLKGKGDGTFKTIPTSESGFYVPDDGRDIVLIKNKKGEDIILVGQNNTVTAKFVWQVNVQ